MSHDAGSTPAVRAQLRAQRREAVAAGDAEDATLLAAALATLADDDFAECFCAECCAAAAREEAARLAPIGHGGQA